MMRQRGLTLIEVLIAIFIAAIMFAIGYGAINQAMRDRESLNVSQARVTEIQRSMRVIAQDFAQIIARASRDTQGSGELYPAVSANGRDNVLITFSRAGWANPAGVSRPAEQRVRYRFLDGALRRDHWLSMDPALNVEPRERVLLTKVRTVTLRFLDPTSRAWRTEWPAGTTTGPLTPAMIDIALLPRPLAIELTIELEDWGRVQRIFEIPT
jgi:general secretion pathway protein J